MLMKTKYDVKKIMGKNRMALALVSFAFKKTTTTTNKQKKKKKKKERKNVRTEDKISRSIPDLNS